MRLQFKCKCGAKLKCLIQGIGHILPCPNCHSDIKVPTPPRAVVQQTLKPLPLAMPECSSIEYAALVAQIDDLTRFNLNLCKRTLQTDLAYRCVDDAIRILRNVLTFLHHKTEDADSIARIGGVFTPSPLSSIAAGSNFGGIGARKSKIRQHKKWERSGEEPATPTPRHPLAEQVIASIQSLKIEIV